MKYFFLLLCFIPEISNAQDFLPNGDFEEEVICEEYNQKCGPMAWRLTASDPPDYYGDFVEGDSSRRNHWTSFVPFSFLDHGNYREYLQAPLLCPLRKGIGYLLSFQVKAREIAVNEIDIRFSASVTITPKNQIIVANPQVKLINENFWVDPEDKWMNVNVRYVADGTERFILIGNFQPQLLTKYKRIYNVSYNSYMSKYYIDNIHLIAEDGEVCYDTAYLTLLHKDRKRHTMDTANFFPNRHPVMTNQNSSPKVTLDQSVVLHSILFETDKYQILPESFPVLDSIADILKVRLDLAIEITGHTDSSGMEAHNLPLSKNRAKAVMFYLIQKGIDTARITTEGFASLKPIAPNNSPDGRKVNRRVEITFHLKNKIPANFK